MTTMERAEGTVKELERMAREAVRSERLHEVAEPIAQFAASRRPSWPVRREPAAAAIDRGPRAPHGLVVALRAAGWAWAALMLSTLTIAIATRASARRTSIATQPDDDEIRLRTVLGPMAFRSRATALRGGTLECWYGGGFVDLREATLDPAGAVLRVRAIFGGGQIIVPATWRVTTRVRGVGGATDTRKSVDVAEDAPQLRIEGVAIFGGFAVQSELPDAQAAEVEAAVRRTWGDERQAGFGEPEAIPAV